MRSAALVSALTLSLLASAAFAQINASGDGNTVPQLQTPAEETIDIGLSTETIAITSNFGGTDLTIFGALDNADPMIQRQGRYDIIVVLQGPERNLVVRKKERYLGVWINADSETFLGVPLSYSLASTRNLQDIADEKVYRQLSVGVRNFYLNPEDPSSLSGNIPKFGTELREMKIRQGLYNQRIGGVEFVSRTLFRATLNLPANVPVGRHKARALLFRNGVFLREANAGLEIVKAGLEQSVYNAAHQYSLLYGLFAVFLAVFTGWFGRILFRKD
ncbi:MULTISPECIES: TIGR02186 family protein [Brucella/Ochrobactrum group]|uniref:TIGR02186 family protein n=2 Tax=Ochrobactrum TaxID=528 RepID=A0ABD5JR52_9HYPH|nr:MULTISPECIES: TIGR02186 family protein [Brucella]MCI0999107.1 TIGR02186 family protein [Ochrobactrum sp. C6C9]RRD23737.1 TIGR02186 family protein [Brucellaceae bacterium VT-16-1752]WHT43922.1 TIGR02186 family protein [Ochrobactrum sp. SSR]MDX4072852.1 TIGR02186 family protein [Brucella sp. NBRC 113783]RLL73349.1 TIGR02186 family protein [[Ochrobactrum] soli]